MSVPVCGTCNERACIVEFLEAAKKLHSENVEFAILGYCDEDYQQQLDDLEKQGVITQI